jgi:uncharacterized membrane protein
MDKAMLHTLKVYLLLLPIFFLIDYIWLGQVMVGFYKQELGPLARKAGEDLNPLIWAAIVVYLFIPLGIVLFALPRVSQENWVLSSVGWGFAYGVILYVIYEMTNLSMLAGWPLKLSFVDILWGGVLCGTSTFFAACLDRWLS